MSKKNGMRVRCAAQSRVRGSRGVSMSGAMVENILTQGREHGRGMKAGARP